MSRFFDLLQRLSEGRDGTGTKFPGPSSAATKTELSDVDHALAILRAPRDEDWPDEAPQHSEVQQHSVIEAANGGSEIELDQIPVVQVQLGLGNRIVLESDPRGFGADRFRLLRMRLVEIKAAKNLRSLLITSPLPEEGKSTVALNLATALTEGGRRKILLMEADLHRSPLIEKLGVPSGPGLAECLEDGVNPMKVLRRIEPLGWYVLFAGHSRSNPTELLQGVALSEIMDQLLPHFDWIIVDSPPITPLSDALSLAQRVDGSLMVVRAGCTPINAIETAMGLLGKQNVLGIVLNAVKQLDGLYSRYSTYYSNGTGEDRNLKQAATSGLQ